MTAFSSFPSRTISVLAGLLLVSCSPDAANSGPDTDVGTTVSADAAADAWVSDASPDAARFDAEAGPDMSVEDAADGTFRPDLGDCVPSADDLPLLSAIPQTLSETGLYLDIDSRTLHPRVQTFSPRYPLWSDGSQKTRWVYLPSCPKIDNADPDHWSMPVGARFWKEFEVDGVVVETRFFYRFGPGEEDFYFGAYAWADDDSEATFTIPGVPNARGTSHDVPSIHGCEGCHLRIPERILGFSAIQLNHNGPGVTVADLAEHLTQPAAAIEPVGGLAAQEALGYLHGNCGNCHNGTALATQHDAPLDLRLSVEDLSVEQTGAARTAIGVDVNRVSHPNCSVRIAPGSPDTSCLVLRMELRGQLEQMPPIGSERVDPEGVQTVSDWISGL